MGFELNCTRKRYRRQSKWFCSLLGSPCSSLSVGSRVVLPNACRWVSIAMPNGKPITGLDFVRVCALIRVDI